MRNHDIKEYIMLVDQTSDLNGQAIYRLSKLHELPDFVKEADTKQVFGASTATRPHMCAHPRLQMFPCNSKVATWISAALFEHQRDQLPDKEASMVEERLR